jgi:ComF family protein
MAVINDFLSLIYPRHCEACARLLFGHEHYLCRYCQAHLPKSNYHTYPDSPLKKTFSGRVPLVHAASCYLYEKSGRIQRLLHAIKYEEQKELGKFLGQMYGKELKEGDVFKDIQCILPVPLHKNKLKARGFNQSEWFAQGIAESMNIVLDTDSLERIADTSTQTKKKKFQRWENVEGIFRVRNNRELANKHVLLVDDVITTGATIEACWQALKPVPGIRISVASIAFAAKS